MANVFPLAIVTGAAQRLGRAFALFLAQKGYAVLLHYHSSTTQVQATADEIRELSTPVFVAQADLTDAAQIDALFAVVDEALAHPNIGQLSMLVNSAAVMHRADARTLSASAFDATLALNLRAPFLCAQHAFARMTAGGLIVNITDVAAQKAWPGFPDYTVSKAGLASLTGVLARAFAPNVRVNAIAPGLVLPSDDTPDEVWQRLVRRTPLGRSAQLDEITSTLLFLLENEYVTGQTIVMDGGYSLI
jgi:NAD(P)-dependent dehydrogenase (short-subunit alcohol dehydrogenase family)